MGTGPDYLDHLARDSARFAAALRGAAPAAPVPSCPGWDSDDLLWHLAEVQWFWGTVVREGIAGEPGPGRDPCRAGARQPGLDLVGGSHGRVRPPPPGARGADSPGGRRTD